MRVNWVINSWNVLNYFLKMDILMNILNYKTTRFKQNFLKSGNFLKNGFSERLWIYICKTQFSIRKNFHIYKGKYFKVSPVEFENFCANFKCQSGIHFKAGHLRLSLAKRMVLNWRMAARPCVYNGPLSWIWVFLRLHTPLFLIVPLPKLVLAIIKLMNVQLVIIKLVTKCMALLHLTS